MREQEDEIELEYKFDVTAAQFKRLKKLSQLRELRVSKPASKRLESIYFDTLDFALREHGVSLRIRKTSDGFLQTFKLSRDTSAGLFARREVEFPVSSNYLDIEKLCSLLDEPRLIRILSKHRLKPVFTTIIDRTLHILDTEVGSQVEVAFDDVQIETEYTAQQFYELELELKSGSRSCLFDLARKFVNKQDLAFSELSKAERAYRMLVDEAPSECSAAKALPPNIGRQDTIETAFEKTLQSCNEQITRNLRFLCQSKHSEGPHQLRIGLRRLRSGIKAMRPTIDTSELRDLSAQARELGQLIAELRDADVLQEDIVSCVVASGSIQAGLDRLQDQLSRHRARTRRRIVKLVSNGRASRLQIDLTEQITCQPWRGEVKGTRRSKNKMAQQQAALSLSRSWKTVGKWGRQLDRLSVPERHEMRKELKGLRYQVEFFSSIYPKKKVKPFIKNLKELQNVFGYLNDVAMAEHLVELAGNEFPDDVDLKCAVAYVLGWHTNQAESAWQNARTHWQSLEQLEPFWM